MTVQENVHKSEQGIDKIRFFFSLNVSQALNNRSLDGFYTKKLLTFKIDYLDLFKPTFFHCKCFILPQVL